VAICLLDEVSALKGSPLAPLPIAVPADDALPLIVQSQRARIAKDGETLQISDEEQGETTVRLIDVSDLVVFGNVSITTPALATLFEREFPVTFLSHRGWFRGIAHSPGHRNVELRTAQFRQSFDDAFCLRFRSRSGRCEGGQPAYHAAPQRPRRSRPRHRAGAPRWANCSATETIPSQFDVRNRLPPMDSINSMLSLAYAMLARHLTVALASVGLDPYRGFYHAPRYGRPSLALDMMEPFRPIIAGSAVLSVVNTGELCAADFVVATTGTALTTAGCGAVSSRRLSAGCPRRRPTHSSAIESACVGCCWCRLGCYHAFCWVNCRPIRTTCRVEPS